MLGQEGVGQGFFQSYSTRHCISKIYLLKNVLCPIKFENFSWIICLLIVTLGTVTKKGKLNKPMEKT